MTTPALRLSIILAGCFAPPLQAASLDLIAPFGLFNGSNTASSGVSAINNSGQVVVSANNPSGSSHTFVWTTGGATEIINTRPGLSGTVYGEGINDLGQVTGDINSGSGAFVWSGGTMTEVVNTLGSGQIFSKAINNAGQVVGQIMNWDGHTSFKWASNTMTALERADTTTIYVQDINHNGQAVGAGYDNSAGGYRALYWDNTGQATVIPTPDANVDAFAYAISNNGYVVGNFSDPDSWGTQHALFWDGETSIDLGDFLTSSFQSSTAYGVNDHGQVVGDASGAFLYENGNLTYLNDLVADLLVEEGSISGFVSLNTAYDINELGQIIGTGTYYDSLTDATYDMGFVLSLSGVPEPSTYAALSGLAVLGLALVRRRTRQQHTTTAPRSR